MMQTPAWTTWIGAAEFEQALGRDDLVVIDARFELADPGAGETAWRQARIPGARYAHLDRDLSARADSGAEAVRRGQGRHPWPDAADFVRRLGEWGVTPASQVVVYDDAGGALAAARVWFLLRALGHMRVAVLDGGWRHWLAQDLPIERGTPMPAGTATAPYPGRFDDALLLDAPQVQAHLDAGGLLVDARAAERFRGDVEPIDRVGGHVPGALNRPFTDNLRDGLAKPPAELKAEFARLLDGRSPDALVAMCGSGVTACHHLLALAHAGMARPGAPGPRLFTGSWSGWIEDPARPVATGG
ncbi:sulfurtransferase [Marilutibacter chinensis]|uniref:Sulfurtransferase n=1 Tax=Marilutibacter chinensis TaxID=2912247 RepID=A0ABS9HX38_9GAMM|nr:sulfurtransferase [Lysobacter chinensis]MCF7222607.1 sulfurtransferase [Lysobacter chinensis]